MRRVSREPLSEAALALLCRRTCQIADAGHRHRTISERWQARKREAARLWDQERTRAFDEINAVLRRMAPSTDLCMYCEHSAGSDIDHFWPKEKYPARAYTWENYLWACSICNTHFKGTQFPRDERGKPLLINPAEEDPRDHLELSPTTGKLLGKTPKGEKTRIVLGFHKRGYLDEARRDAFRAIQKLVAAYAEACQGGDAEEARACQRLICRHPLASTLSTLLQLLDSPRGASLIDPRCRAAVEAHPEIRTWP
ncbi:hypothetical protein [Sorangium sp. So ce385]|uniref:hypothetical protein n=1 Tax=Sorangium sp. So ce385 TaxID=3133308 RepID=UPI003F5C9718